MLLHLHTPLRSTDAFVVGADLGWKAHTLFGGVCQVLLEGEDLPVHVLALDLVVGHVAAGLLDGKFSLLNLRSYQLLLIHVLTLLSFRLLRHL